MRKRKILLKSWFTVFEKKKEQEERENRIMAITFLLVPKAYVHESLCRCTITAYVNTCFGLIIKKTNPTVQQQPSNIYLI